MNKAAPFNDPVLDLVRDHLTRLGFEFGVPQAWVSQKLRHMLGAQRFAEFDRAVSDPDLMRREFGVPEFGKTMQEANLIRSHSTDVTLVTTHVLYSIAREHFRSGIHILELGCYTAPLASFIAAQHPECKVTGVDRVKKLIALNRAHFKLPNLAFHMWDYSQRKPSKITEADVLLCSLGIVNVNNGGYELDSNRTIRQHSAYNRQKEHALTFFNNWRTAARAGADLYAILRIGTVGRLQAFLDAAVEAGWAPQHGAFKQIFIQTANDMLAMLAFRAEPAEPTSEETTAALYIQLMARTEEPSRIGGAMALEVYRSFRHKTVLNERTTTTPRGIKTRQEIGIVGSAGYVFVIDEQPDYALVFVPVAEALRLQKLPQPPAAHFVAAEPQSTRCINVPAHSADAVSLLSNLGGSFK